MIFKPFFVFVKKNEINLDAYDKIVALRKHRK